jgi:hypothetical protein
LVVQQELNRVLLEEELLVLRNKRSLKLLVALLMELLELVDHYLELLQLQEETLLQVDLVV